jgi:hypothetical protein
MANVRDICELEARVRQQGIFGTGTLSVFRVQESVEKAQFNIKYCGTVLLHNVLMHRALLTANCEVFALDEYVVKTNEDGCVFGLRWDGIAHWCFSIRHGQLSYSRPVIEIQTADYFGLLFGVDNSHSCALLLAVPASFSPDSGRIVGEPET